MEDAHLEHLSTGLVNSFNRCMFETKDEVCMPARTWRPLDKERFNNSISKARTCKTASSLACSLQYSRQFCPDKNYVQLVLTKLVIKPVECVSRVLKASLATYDLMEVG